MPQFQRFCSEENLVVKDNNTVRSLLAVFLTVLMIDSIGTLHLIVSL